MNILFSVIFILCTLFLLCFSPADFLSALLTATSNSAVVCVSLLSTYSIWLGLMQVWKDSGVTDLVSKRLRPIAQKLFHTDDTQTLNHVCMNLSVNLLGISGAGTPYGIQAAKLLDKSPQAEYASALFFVLNATSLQIFPTSLIAVRTSMQSVSPTDIVLPVMLSSLFSTLLGVCLLNVFFSLLKNRDFYPKKLKTRGAGI